MLMFNTQNHINSINRVWLLCSEWEQVSLYSMFYYIKLYQIMSIFYFDFLLTFFVFYVTIIGTSYFFTVKEGWISMNTLNTLNLDALKAFNTNGVVVYQVPILEQYVNNLMEHIPHIYADIVTKPYKSNSSNYFYIDVICNGTDSCVDCVKSIIKYCGNTRIIPLNYC